ncbi:hypothetical protein [Paenibacillus caui]|uniref:hypothetical protein n=1 Tax=Paenibacillus caui TaxID=2873927 RepID=UPI001CA9242D|nr:hypothetical protein [Paenibacillus caui]
MNLEQSTNATFYQYRLLKKTTFSKLLTQGLVLVPILCLIGLTVFHGPLSIVNFLLAAPISLWIQFVICRSVLIIVSHSYNKHWRFSWRLPWVGYMPNQYIWYSIFRKVHLHYTWIGLCIIAVLIPWSPISLIISLLFWHLWLLFPRLFTFAVLLNQRKDGMIKFNEQDVSYYIQ